MLKRIGEAGRFPAAQYDREINTMPLRSFPYTVTGLLALLGGSACSNPPNGAGAIAPANMPHIGTVDERFQSFNVEMIEVTGGRFWKPYKDIAPAPKAQPPGATPAGMDPGLYQQRPPADLNNARLHKLAAALQPTYMRVSGTWANTTYFHDSDTPAPPTPPKGFSGVLTRAQWKSVVDLSKAANARIVTSFAISPGTRDARGVWTPKEARKLLAYTRSLGGDIAAAEFMNEPNIAAIGGAPKGYDAAAFGRDLAVFRSFAKQIMPGMLLLGPGSVGEGLPLIDSKKMPVLKSEDLLAAAGPVFDAFSYHFYGAVSNRCASLGANLLTSAAAALSGDWLSRTDKVEEFYQGLRDRYAPAKPLWVTETGGAACGGNPWNSTFLDSFRYLDQLGRLAKRGVQVVAHNTLAASDYGLLDENSLTPRPSYWAALLWRNLMGATVLDAGPPVAGLNIYAHCLRGSPGGVALLVINTARAESHSLDIPIAADRFSLTAPNLEGTVIRLNGSELKMEANDSIPQLRGVPVAAGRLAFEPASITFLAMHGANNSCR